MNFDKLNEVIALPDWEKRLVPLFLFKGTKPYALRSLLNVAYAMYLSECKSFIDALKLCNAPENYTHKNGKVYVIWDRSVGELGHLCGRHTSVKNTNLHSIFQRMRSPGGIKLTDSIDRSFTEYVEDLYTYDCYLRPVPLGSYDSHGRIAWWRHQLTRPKKVRRWKMPEKSSELSYPFVRSAMPQHQLLLDVHKMIPRSIPHDIRGDLCQDLMVAILSGETTVKNIPDVIHKYAAHARKIMPDRWKTISLDDPIAGADGLTVGDSLGFDCAHEHSDLEYAVSRQALRKSEDDFAPDVVDEITEEEIAQGMPVVFHEEQEPRERKRLFHANDAFARMADVLTPHEVIRKRHGKRTLIRDR